MKRNDRKQVKPDTNQSHPKPHSDGTKENERHISGSVNVRGEVEAKRPPDLTQEHNTERKEDTTHQNKIYVVNLLTLIAVVIYAGLTAWQARSAHETLKAIKTQFRLDQRPYISLDSIKIMDSAAGGSIKERQIFDIGKPLVVTLGLKNIGKSPALNPTIHYHILFGDGLKNFRIEPSDKGKKGITIDQGTERFVSAISIIDTYSRESADTDMNTIVNWDGSLPIVVFGRVSYEDMTGYFYCTPYTLSYLPENWVYAADVVVAGKKFMPSDLCPDKQ